MMPPSYDAREDQLPSFKSPPSPGTAGGKAYASSPPQNFVKLNPQMTKYLDQNDPFIAQDQRKGLTLHQHALQNVINMPNGQSLSFLRSVDLNSGSLSSLNTLKTSYYARGNNRMRPQFENSLFSTSVPELFDRKLALSPNNDHFDHSAGSPSSGHGDRDMFSLPEEIEVQTIGNLLPDDDDLFAGISEGLDFVMRPNSDGSEELDFFSSVGGLELGESETSAKLKYLKSGYNGSVAREHSFGHRLSRTLFVRNINGDADDSELQTLFKQYGDICTLYTASKRRGFIMVSYYDIRAAQKAMENLQNRQMLGRKLDIHYSVPNDNLSQRDTGHGMLVVSNVDHAIPSDELCHIFGIYGEVKQIQSIPYRIHQRLIEFYDSRDAEAAFHALDNRSIAGKQIKLEPIRPGRLEDLLNSPCEMEVDENDLMQRNNQSKRSTSGFYGHKSLGMDNGTPLGMQSAMGLPFLQSQLHHEISASVPNGLPSLGKKSGSTFNSRPETIDSRSLQRVGSNEHSAERGVFGSVGSGSSPLLSHHMWGGNSYGSQTPWQSSSSFVNGTQISHPSARLQGLPRTPQQQFLSRVFPAHAQSHHVGSAPSANHSLWERHQQSYAVGSLDATVLHPGSLGAMRISKNSLRSRDLVSHNIFPDINGNCMDMPVPSSKVVGIQSPHQRYMMYPVRGPIMASVGSFEAPGERVRSRRNEGPSSQADKRQYELDVDRIIKGEDNRTTLMIKNIPNKYTSKMLLAAIDEHHRGTYDFIYLPIDFKNKCNVGYAFINMTDPGQIIPFHKAFNGKKWEKFNSEKVATLAYARIQGKPALIAHFQNSSLMNEDKRCRPILFNTDGPNAGDQVPFPMGVNVRSRPGKARSSFLDEIHQVSPPSATDFSNGDDDSPVKDSD